MHTWVHPYIIDVYYYALKLNELGENLPEDDDDLTEEQQQELEETAQVYAYAEKRAIKATGSVDNVEEQLRIFTDKIGNA